MKDEQQTSRRTMLKLSAAAAPVFVTLKPSAALAASLTQCHINLSTMDTRSQWIDVNGQLTLPKTADAFPPLKGDTVPLGASPDEIRAGNYAYYSSEELREFVSNGRTSVPASVKPRLSSTYETNLEPSKREEKQLKEMQAHVRYIERLGAGQGLTCWMSINGA